MSVASVAPSSLPPHRGNLPTPSSGEASSGFLLPRSCKIESLVAGKMRSQGLVNFVTALAYHICL